MAETEPVVTREFYDRVADEIIGVGRDLWRTDFADRGLLTPKVALRIPLKPMDVVTEAVLVEAGVANPHALFFRDQKTSEIPPDTKMGLKYYPEGDTNKGILEIDIQVLAGRPPLYFDMLRQPEGGLRLDSTRFSVERAVSAGVYRLGPATLETGGPGENILCLARVAGTSWIEPEQRWVRWMAIRQGCFRKGWERIYEGNKLGKKESFSTQAQLDAAVKKQAEMQERISQLSIYGKKLYQGLQDRPGATLEELLRDLELRQFPRTKFNLGEALGSFAGQLVKMRLNPGMIILTIGERQVTILWSEKREKLITTGSDISEVALIMSKLERATPEQVLQAEQSAPQATQYSKTWVPRPSDEKKERRRYDDSGRRRDESHGRHF